MNYSITDAGETDFPKVKKKKTHRIPCLSYTIHKILIPDYLKIKVKITILKF